MNVIGLSINLNKFIPNGRIKSLDILRGFAILIMTLFHQTVPFKLYSSGVGYHLSLFTAYYIVPMFIAVSGIAITFFEKKYRCPFRMIVHGIVLFLMAWSADILVHQSLQVDWDIFQLIGCCYAISGVFNYIKRDDLRFAGLFILIITWLIAKGIRPDVGLRPIWPYGIFFLCGYLIGKWSTSRYSSLWPVFMMLVASIIYLIFFYTFFERSIELSINIYGIIASCAGIYILLCLTLFMENHQLLSGPAMLLLKQFGIYPISLYFIQQFFTVFGPKFGLKLDLSSMPGLNYALQTVLLIVGMLLATFLFDRFRILCVEFWLKKTESIVMKIIPERGIFKTLPVKSVSS